MDKKCFAAVTGESVLHQVEEMANEFAKDSTQLPSV
jgi:hypothetical protein